MATQEAFNSYSDDEEDGGAEKDTISSSEDSELFDLTSLASSRLGHDWVTTGGTEEDFERQPSITRIGVEGSFEERGAGSKQGQKKMWEEIDEALRGVE